MAGIGEALLVRQPSDTACVCRRLAAARLVWPGLYRLFGSCKAQMAGTEETFHVYEMCKSDSAMYALLV